MCFNDRYIASTVVEELEKSNSVFAFGLKLKSPFSTDASTIQGLRAFLLLSRWVSQAGDLIRHVLAHRFFKGYSFKRSFLCRLRVDKRIQTKKQALLAPATCTMINGLHKRVMPFLHHVSILGIPNALIVGMRIKVS